MSVCPCVCFFCSHMHDKINDVGLCNLDRRAPLPPPRAASSLASFLCPFSAYVHVYVATILHRLSLPPLDISRALG